ncbi:hypothetical protein [Ekhidna sp.]
MKSIISLLLITVSFAALSQRVQFEDPDLTFSFKKPKGWEVFDDGYLVKVSPSINDSSRNYFTITYFEDSQPFGGVNLLHSATALQQEKGAYKTTGIKIDGVQAKYSEQKNKNTLVRLYTFYKYDQRFEIYTSIFPSDNSTISRKTRKIVRSIQIEK